MTTRTSRRTRKVSIGKVRTARSRRSASRSADSVLQLPGISPVRRQCSQRHLAGVEPGTQAAIRECE
jgi:hypothetical protein